MEREEPTEQSLDISVEKEWNDGGNRYNTRKEVTVELLANDVSTEKSITLNEANGWKGTFTDLVEKDSDGNKITYTIKEINVPEGYKSEITQDENTYSFKIINTLLTEVKVVKQWDDKENFDEVRPSSLKVTLYSNGVSTEKTVTLDEKINWTATFEGLKKYDSNGNEIDYTVQEETIAKYEKPEYKKEEDPNNGYITWTITNKYEPYYDGYIEISGKVWVDKPDGKGNDIDGNYVAPNTDEDSKDILKEGVTVRLKYIDENGKHQLFNPDLPNAYETKTNSNGEYTIKVNYDNRQNVYKLYEDVATVNKKLETAYVEFEYDGMQYTTVASTTTGVNTSKATENEATRNTFDNKHATVTSGTTHPDNWTDKNITAVTDKVVSYDGKTTQTEQVTVKYCNGDGTYIRTNPEGAWKNILSGTQNLACNNGQGHELEKYEIIVQKIPNINLGLFEREQPDVAIFSDISKVEVEMNQQRYTYLYGVRNDKLEAEGGLKTKFQNKDTYTYRRPVNPADIAYIKEEANKNAMEVYVTYQISVANLSNTLTVVVDSIANDYDSNYIISDIIYGTMNETTGEIEGKPLQDNQISDSVNKNGYFEVVLSGLGIEINGLAESENKIYIRYQIDQTKLPELFNDNTPPLNNATEILSYTTKYGENTLYAEQRTHLKEKEQGRTGRDGKSYAGYDYDSHPENANIQLMAGEDGVQRLYSTDANGNLIPTDQMEEDTDIAPAFVLCKDDPKTLGGIVWEDANANIRENERLGDGYKDSDEATAQNVKVELYNLEGQLAKLYSLDGAAKDAVTYTDENGYYQLEGVVTGEYYLKFTYGDDTTELQQGATTMDGGETTVNARNYKSTIITDPKIKEIMTKNYGEEGYDDKWHITHTPGYSVAVDNMLDRLEIPDLQYSNFNDEYTEPQNMTAYTKPFKTQIEFEANGQSYVDALGNISGVTNVLSTLDFGISERPRENLYAQKTISYIKLTLANGQVLTEGDPRTQDLSYVKAMGFGQIINSAVSARNAIEKQLLIEIDSELIQGAQLEVDYEVTVTNENELDYDYGTKEDYQDIVGNNYITKSSKAKYYYYGDDEGLGKNDEIKATIEFVDYLNSELVYNVDTNTDWKSKAIGDLKDENSNKLVSAKVEDFITENDYRVLVSNVEGSLDGKVTLARGASLERPLKMSVSKLLSNQAENVYDNGIEIIKIDGKTARTIQESQSGKQIEKEYKPGNYIPNALSDELEQDDDRVKFIITPPTGININIIIYIMTALVGLVVIVVGIVFIKKKVLTK